MISLIHPSRGRPEQSRETINNWLIRSYHKTEVIISLDSDDPKLNKYTFSGNINPVSHDPKIRIINYNRAAIDAVNVAATEANGDILIVVSDDTDCPVHWDKIILDAVAGRKDFVLKVNDGIQKNIVTMPIMDRAYYERDGYIYNPIYKHAYADTELTEVAKRRGRLVKRMDITFPHNHYSVTGKNPDDTYKRSDAHYEAGKALYQQRLKRNFDL